MITGEVESRVDEGACVVREFALSANFLLAANDFLLFQTEEDFFHALGGVFGDGLNFFVVHEGVVDEAAFVRIHGVHPDFFATFFDFVGEVVGLVLDLLFLFEAEIFAVETDAIGVGIGFAHDAVDEVLQVVEAFAVFSDDEFVVFGVEVEDVVVLGRGGDFDLKSKFFEDGLGDFFSFRNFRHNGGY